MALLNPYSLRLQITRMFEQGQSFFAPPKVETWLREHQVDPKDYEIRFVQKMAPVGSEAAMLIWIELRRRDGQPVDPWLQAEVNRDA